MTDEIIPEDVRQFIIQNIDSVAQLECLLLLRLNRGETWSAEKIAKGLYVKEEEAAELLKQLVTLRCCDVEPGLPMLYRYKPETPVLEQMIARIAELYSYYLIPVTHLIHAKPARRIQAFADAFRLRKD